MSASGPSRSTRPPRGLLLLLATVCVLALICVYLFWVRTHTGQDLDERAFDGRLASVRARGSANAILSTITVSSLVIAICVLAGQALLRHRPALALLAGASIVTSVGIAEILKRFVLTRPDLLPSAVFEGNSFPSGHTTIAFSVGIAAVLVALARWRRLVTVLAFLYGSAIAVAVIAAGWHRPSDVVGGILISTGTAAAVTLVVVLIDRDAFAPHRQAMRPRHQHAAAESWPAPVASLHYLIVAAAVLCAGALAAVTVAALNASRVQIPPIGAGFVLACASIVAFAAIMLAALLTVLRDALPAG